MEKDIDKFVRTSKLAQSIPRRNGRVMPRGNREGASGTISTQDRRQTAGQSIFEISYSFRGRMQSDGRIDWDF